MVMEIEGTRQGMPKEDTRWDCVRGYVVSFSRSHEDTEDRDQWKLSSGYRTAGSAGSYEPAPAVWTTQLVRGQSRRVANWPCCPVALCRAHC